MKTCGVCGGELVTLGKLGSRRHYRCRQCGLDQSTDDSSHKHYHVLGGLNGCYMPDSNDVCFTKREAQDCLKWHADQERERIACDKQDAQPGDHVDKLSGSYRDGCYIVERSPTQIDYCYQIEQCWEAECLEDEETL